MKWLFLIFLIACGKHETPPARDVFDADGDGVLNAEEASVFEKYTARIESLGQISGTIRFSQQKTVELAFTNQKDLQQMTLDLMVGKIDSANEDYFTEWSKLNFATIPDIDLTSDSYPLKFTFELTQEKPTELTLVKEHVAISLGSWSHNMLVNISRADLIEVLNGRAYFALKKNFGTMIHDSTSKEESVRRKTYRLFLFDGHKASLYYVAKENSLKDFLASQGIADYRNIDDEDLFLSRNFQEVNQWWVNQLYNNDVVVAFSSASALSKVYLEKFTQSSQLVKRENGYSTSGITIDKSLKAKVYFKIRAHKTARSFVETVGSERHRSGGGREGDFTVWHCTLLFRAISTEVSEKVELDAVLKTISLSKNGAAITPDYLQDFEVLEEVDEQGLYWDVKIKVPADKIEMKMETRDPSTFVLTGRYAHSCGGASTSPTNTEGIFQLSVESFVEKQL